MKINLKKLLKFVINNYLISIFIAVIVFVGFISVFKFFFLKPTYIYAKVKLGQGLWWASTQKPSLWFVNAIKKGDQEKSLTGDAVAEVLSVKYYPWISTTNQYDVYLDVKLKVSGSKNTKKYNFKRSTIGVGAPIDFEFPTVQVSGTIIKLSDKPITDKYTYKTISLTKRGAYPWEYDAIKIGDKYFDGNANALEILDKNATDTTSLSSDNYGNYSASTAESRKYITVKAKIKVKKYNNQLIFGEEQLVSIGKPLYIATPNFTFQDYIVGAVE